MTELPERTALYRLYDADGRLLYVGIAAKPSTRWGTHSREKLWWPEVARKTVEWHVNRAAAMAVEAQAIKTEAPRFNVVGTPAHGDRVRQAHADWRVRARRELRQALAEQQSTTSGMRLVAMIRKAARTNGLDFEMLRQRGIHQVWRCGQTQVTIAQHAKVPEAAAQKVMEALEDELGKGWWR